MKPPPFLLGATLLFWGWQVGLLWVGAILAIVLVVAPWSTLRWDLSDEDFSRIWVFCSVLLLASLAFAFTANQGPASFVGFLSNPNLAHQQNVGLSGARTAASVLRWLPIIFFPLVAAQMFSPREGIPLETTLLMLRRRWLRAKREGRGTPPITTFNVGYPYFALCLLGASAHGSEGNQFFWSLCVLFPWALWPVRSRRFAAPVWVAVLLVALGLGYGGQRALGQLQHWIENYNPRWFFHFSKRGSDPTQSQTAIGQVGGLQLSGQIVIRLETLEGPVPRLLREASYQTYGGRTWYSGTTEKDFIPVDSLSDGTTWPLLPGKTNQSAVKIGCYLDGGKALLPLPSGSGRLEALPANELKTNTLGAVLAIGPGLVIFNALYGPGASLDGPPDPRSEADTSPPPSELQELDQVIDELHLRNQTREQVLRTLGNFFQRHFRYSTFQGPLPTRTNQTSLGRFLNQTRQGHCEYFATATVLLLQRLHIPARYATGYAVHEGAGNKYVVRQRDAHAWCLVWNKQSRTWDNFDTTPASWIEAEEQRASRLQFLSDFWSRLMFEIARIRWGQTGLRQYILWSLVPILSILFSQIIFHLRRRRQRGPGAGQLGVIWPGLDSEFYELISVLTRRGVPRAPGQSLGNWLSRILSDPSLEVMRHRLSAPLGLHYRYRFDPHGLSPTEREALRREAQACLQTLEHLAKARSPS
jgi:hypothetical protein